MQKVDAFDAKTHFSKLKNKVLKAFYKWRKGIRWDDSMNTKKAITEGRR